MVRRLLTVLSIPVFIVCLMAIIIFDLCYYVVSGKYTKGVRKFLDLIYWP